MANSILRTQDNSKQQEVGKTQVRYTVTQLIRYFAAQLPASSNYPRHAKAYVKDCLKKGFAIDTYSFVQYTAELPPNRIAPLRKFHLFYQTLGQPQIINDPNTHRIPPAANELVLRFIREAKTLRGDRSKETYTKALNAFFAYVHSQHQLGETASLSGQTVNDFVQHLKDQNYSAFTVNLYLSSLKQLVKWCIRKRDELTLTPEQLNSLRDVNDVPGLAIERTFYKDSLEKQERQHLFVAMESARDRAILAFLGIEGLRTVEVTRLRLGDLDFDQQQILVLGKGKHTRKPIKFFAACREIVQTYLVERGQWPLSRANRDLAVFPDLKTHQIRYIVDKRLRQTGLKRVGVSAHSLRHTVGQLLLEDGVSLEHVQQHLRHETLETTQFYTKKQTRKSYFKQMPD